jgi:hypothetical protein
VRSLVEECWAGQADCEESWCDTSTPRVSAWTKCKLRYQQLIPYQVLIPEGNEATKHSCSWGKPEKAGLVCRSTEARHWRSSTDYQALDNCRLALVWNGIDSLPTLPSSPGKKMPKPTSLHHLAACNRSQPEERSDTLNRLGSCMEEAVNVAGKPLGGMAELAKTHAKYWKVQLVPIDTMESVARGPPMHVQ